MHERELLMNNPFQEELNFYRRNKKTYLSKYKNQYVLIKGKRNFGNYINEEEAYKAGIEKFGNEPFLIKKVEEHESPEVIPTLTLGIINASSQ